MTFELFTWNLFQWIENIKICPFWQFENFDYFLSYCNYVQIDFTENMSSRQFFPYSCKKIFTVSKFQIYFSISDFTWNQFLEFKNCPFCSFGGNEFCFEPYKFNKIKSGNFRNVENPENWFHVKSAEKFYDFHTVKSFKHKKKYEISTCNISHSKSFILLQMKYQTFCKQKFVSQ